jgi:hypothetical protein
MNWEENKRSRERNWMKFSFTHLHYENEDEWRKMNEDVQKSSLFSYLNDQTST